MLKKIKRVLKLKTKMAELEKEHRELRAELKAELSNRDVSLFEMEGHSVKLIEYIKSDFDTSTFKSQHADLYAQFLVEQVISRLDVK